MNSKALQLGMALALIATASVGLAQSASPYKVLKVTQAMGSGAIDYVFADNDNRRLYVPRGNQVLVFDLDSLAPVGAITNARAGCGD